jgi:hypothetical protein
MTKRLQVLLDDSELQEIRMVAKKEQLTVAEWVRQALRAARQEQSRIDPVIKSDATPLAVQHEFPVGEIDQMLDEIARGYRTNTKS